MKRFAGVALANVCLAGSALAGPWIVSENGQDFDWSNLSLKVQGEVAAVNGNPDGLRQVDRIAWREGFDVSADAFESLVKAQAISLKLPGNFYSSENPAMAEGRAAFLKSVKSLQTVYYSSGHVRASMQGDPREIFGAMLGKIGAGSETFKTSADVADATLIFEVPRNIQPTIAFWLIDVEGDVLFGPKNISSAAVQRGSMARWYTTSVSAPQSKAQQKQRLKVIGVRGTSHFVVDRAAFDALEPSARKALVAGNVAMVGV